MKKPDWYEDEIESLCKTFKHSRETAIAKIDEDIEEYREMFSEFENSENIAWEYYEYVRDYFIEKERFARKMYLLKIRSGEITTLEEQRIMYECMNQHYFENFSYILEERCEKKK